MSDTTSDNDSIQESPVPPDIMKYSRGPSSVAALVERATTVESQFAEFNKRLAKAEIELGTRIEQKRAEIESLRDTLTPDQRRRSLDKAVASVRKEVVDGSDKSRWEALRQMAKAEEEILAVESQFASASHLLSRAGLGSPERSRYLEQIAVSGPSEVANFAALAVATGDQILGAALLSKLDRMSKRDRELTGVSRQSLANALTGAEYRDAQAAIQRIKNRLREAMANNRAFQTGKRVNVRDKLGLALKRDAEKGADDEH